MRKSECIKIAVFNDHECICLSCSRRKILLVPPKSEIIINFVNIAIAILDFSPCKVTAFNLLCLIFCIISLLLSFISLFLVIALPTIVKSNKFFFNFHDCLWKRAITICRAIQNRSHESIYKTNTEMKQRG